MGPVLFSLSGRAGPKEQSDGWAFMEKAIGITVAVVVIGGLFVLCAWADADCSDVWTSGQLQETRATGCSFA